MNARGIDVSVWQDDNATSQKIDFNKAVSAGASFAYIKASQLAPDSDFVDNWKNAKDSGILRGAYHYLDWRESELTQAYRFVSMLKNDHGELPPMADFEMKPMPSDAQGRLWNFLQIVERELGVIPGIYCGYYSWTEYGTPNKGWARYPLWLAWWRIPQLFLRIPKPWTTWTFWQYDDKGDGLAFGAESKQIDVNWYNGTEAQLHDKYGGSVKFCPTCGQKIP